MLVLNLVNINFMLKQKIYLKIINILLVKVQKWEDGYLMEVFVNILLLILIQMQEN